MATTKIVTWHRTEQELPHYDKSKRFTVPTPLYLVWTASGQVYLAEYDPEYNDATPWHEAFEGHTLYDVEWWAFVPRPT